MTRIITLLVAIIVAASAFGFDAPARADQVTYNVSTTPSMRTTDFTQSLTIPTFDTTLGKLNSVQVSYVVNSDITGTVTNTAAIDETFTVNEATAFKLSLGTTSLLNNALSASQAFTQVRPNVPRAYGPFDQTATVGPATYTMASAPAIFDAFDGPAHTLALTFSTATNTQIVGGGGNIDTTIRTLAGATITVQYFYTATSIVPEPASMAMTMIGGLLAGSCWFAKRRGRVQPIG